MESVCVVVRRYIDYLILLIPTPLYLFFFALLCMLFFAAASLLLVHCFNVFHSYNNIMYSCWYMVYTYMTIYKSTNLQSVNIKTLKSSNRSNKIMFDYLSIEQ